ncbi:MAG: hypothetical protein HC786_02660 [Richelia sp. CSU_2_1]|nr:hypothetical protein [Richelia sp. CSU_2_1]
MLDWEIGIITNHQLSTIDLQPLIKADKRGSTQINCINRSTVNCQLSTVNYQLSTINSRTNAKQPTLPTNNGLRNLGLGQPIAVGI